MDYGTPEETLDELVNSVGQQIEALAAAGYFTEEAMAAIEPEKISQFLMSDIGVRMRQAFFRGTLKREQQFVMAAEINGNPEGLMQGIIDAFFVEEGERVILVDYKTDRRCDEQYFIEQYQKQQAQYARALESATGLPVTEKILYSVELGREIHLS